MVEKQSCSQLPETFCAGGNQVDLGQPESCLYYSPPEPCPPWKLSCGRPAIAFKFSPHTETPDSTQHIWHMFSILRLCRTRWTGNWLTGTEFGIGIGSNRGYMARITAECPSWWTLEYSGCAVYIWRKCWDSRIIPLATRSARDLVFLSPIFGIDIFVGFQQPHVLIRFYFSWFTPRVLLWSIGHCRFQGQGRLKILGICSHIILTSKVSHAVMYPVSSLC